MESKPKCIFCSQSLRSLNGSFLFNGFWAYSSIQTKSWTHDSCFKKTRIPNFAKYLATAKILRVTQKLKI